MTSRSRLVASGLVADQPMCLVERSTPFESHSSGELTLAASEPQVAGVTLRLELQTDAREPAGVTAPWVMVGVRISGVATDFVQGYLGRRLIEPPRRGVAPRAAGSPRDW
jgi:hypothetical protein